MVPGRGTIRHGSVCRVKASWCQRFPKQWSPFVVVDYLSASGSTAWVSHTWEHLYKGYQSPGGIKNISVDYLFPLSTLELLALQAPDEVSQG